MLEDSRKNPTVELRDITNTIKLDYIFFFIKAKQNII